ncbi:bacteriocin [Flavobacterium flabelliforme]|nr:bacteriocin [Flavobacterium flabelliforme]
MNLENLNLVELNAQEVQRIDGGWYIIRITGFLDGIDGNFRASFFGGGSN